MITETYGNDYEIVYGLFALKDIDKPVFEMVRDQAGVGCHNVANWLVVTGYAKYQTVYQLDVGTYNSLELVVCEHSD